MYKVFYCVFFSDSENFIDPFSTEKWVSSDQNIKLQNKKKYIFHTSIQHLGMNQVKCNVLTMKATLEFYCTCLLYILSLIQAVDVLVPPHALPCFRIFFYSF